MCSFLLIVAILQPLRFMRFCLLCFLLILLFHILFMLRDILLSLLILIFSLYYLFIRRRTDGSSLLLMHLWLISNRLYSRFLTETIQVDLAQRLILLSARLQYVLGTIVLLFWRTFLILSFFGKELLCLITNFLIFAKGIIQCLILLIADFEARFSLHLSQFFFIFKEFNCRLKTYI